MAEGNLVENKSHTPIFKYNDILQVRCEIVLRFSLPRVPRNRSRQVLSRGPPEERIPRSSRHTGPDLTVRIAVKDRIAKLLLSQYVWASGAFSNHDGMP